MYYFHCSTDWAVFADIDQIAQTLHYSNASYKNILTLKRYINTLRLDLFVLLQRIEWLRLPIESSGETQLSNKHQIFQLLIIGKIATYSVFGH